MFSVVSEYCDYLLIKSSAIECLPLLWPLCVADADIMSLSCVFGRQFVKRFALCYRSVVCLSVCPVCPVLSCLSVCDVRALWPNGWTDQDETWHAGRPRPWPHCVRWGVGTQLSLLQRGTASPTFGPYLLRPNGCMDQDVTWYGARPRPRRLCVRWGPRSPAPKGDRVGHSAYPMQKSTENVLVSPK